MENRDEDTEAQFVIINFSIGLILLLHMYLLDASSHIRIWEVSPQLSWGDTSQIWAWYVTGMQCFECYENQRKLIGEN